MTSGRAVCGLCLVFAGLSGSMRVRAAEQRVVLREHLGRAWTNELLRYPFSAPAGVCSAGAVTLSDPHGRPVAVQLSDVEFWPGTESVKTAQLSFIADLAPLSTDVYTLRCVSAPDRDARPATDLSVEAAGERVEIVTAQFGARLLLGERVYTEPVPASEVPGPVLALRLADGTWFGGSELYGPGRLTAWSARLTDAGPVFARVAVRYTYENGNALDVALEMAAGDNTVRFATNVRQHQPDDGFRLIISRGAPPLIFHVQDEARGDRECFQDRTAETRTRRRAGWCDIPLADYVSPPGRLPGLVTQLSPWEDWFGTFTQTRIRLKLEGTDRELQIRSLDPGAWVRPRPIEVIFGIVDAVERTQEVWAGRTSKKAPLIRGGNGDVFLQINVAEGERKWSISDCLSMPGVASLYVRRDYRPERTFPPETRPMVNHHLNEVKDYVLEWDDRPDRHPRLFATRTEIEAIWRRQAPDPGILDDLLSHFRAERRERILDSHQEPSRAVNFAIGAYMHSGGDPEIAARTHLMARLEQALRYDLWGMQFTTTGAPTVVLYDTLIDSGLIPATERAVWRARMAYFGYRLMDPAVWSAERGYASGNQNMTVNWEISRGLMACAIAEHPMAGEWYANARQLMEHFLDHMVGPEGEWPEAMGGHGRHSINMLLAFALASANSGLHDYVSDPRLKRLVMFWARMLTPRDPRPRGHGNAAPDRRYFPAMGRDTISAPGGTCGVMARASHAHDPDYAEILQWAWREEGASRSIGHLYGFEYVAFDDNLPCRIPAWTSEVFPHVGAMLRHGLGTADEHQVLLYSGDHSTTFYPGHAGSIPGIFAYGTPVAGGFPGGYYFQDELLLCHVTLAREVGSMAERSAVSGYRGSPRSSNSWSWPDDAEPRARFGEQGGLAGVSSFSTLSRQDYAAVDKALHFPRGIREDWPELPDWPPIPESGKPPVDWRRQVLFLKDDDPGNAAYLLIRDSVKGGQPTMWQMWTVSEKIGTPAEMRNPDAFLADKPGHAVLPARELPGDRFTAIGQLGVDVEYYIAAPTDTPRHTLRWGTDMINWANKLAQPEYQDLLHLQMPGDGNYFVAFYPRKRDWPAPVFATLGGGHIIEVNADWGTDYGFLSALPAEAAGEVAAFRGTAASVQNRATGLVLTLGAAGWVSFGGYAVESGSPAGLRVQPDGLVVELPQGHTGVTVRLRAPGDLSLRRPLPGMRVQAGQSLQEWVLTVPSGATEVELERK